MIAMMLNKLENHLKRPALYCVSTSKFWDDEHISKGMLEAHLNPTWDAASRNHAFIDESVKWICEIAPASTNNKLLDLGCGPGLYTERLYQKGYSVTGIDFSKRSLEYAQQAAKKNNCSINYIYKNYLEIDYNNFFDIIIMIYCDFGALSSAHREIILKKVYQAMTLGGKFIFDVFTPNQYDNKKESNTWSYCSKSGFWKAVPYLCLQTHYIYDDNISLEQYTIIDNADNVDVYRVWDHYYTKATIIEELEKIGFSKIEFYSDVSGNPYTDNSKTMCIVVEK
jgi:SAM-dependent methyltransferase